MINKRVIRTVIFNTYVYSCDVIDVLTDVCDEEVSKISVEVLVITVRAGVVIDEMSGVSLEV